MDSLPQRYTLRDGKNRKGEQKFRPDPKKYLFNIDTLYYTIEIKNYDAVMDAGLRDLLEEGRNVYYESAEGDPLNTVELKLPGYENPVLFEIMGGQRNVASYSIRNSDYAVYFRKADNTPGTNPIKVQINQYKLWSMGYTDAYVESLQILSALGFEWGTAKPNRIDLCVHSDQWHWTYDDLKDFEYPRDIKNSNHPNFIHLDPTTGEFETVYYGSRHTGLILRMYNKSIESIRKDKPYFLDLYKEKGLNPERVWNIEFEITRKYLKDFIHPDTFEPDFFDDMENLLSQRGLSFLWTFLTTKFCHPSAHWSTIQKGDVTKFTLLKDSLVRHKDIDTSRSREVAQIYGRLKKIVLRELTRSGAELDQAVDVFKKLAKEYEEDTGKEFGLLLEQERLKIVDNRINSLVFRKKARELTGHIHEVREIEKQIDELELQRMKHMRDLLFRKGKVTEAVALDKLIRETEEKRKSPIAYPASDKGHQISVPSSIS